MRAQRLPMTGHLDSGHLGCFGRNVAAKIDCLHRHHREFILYSFISILFLFFATRAIWYTVVPVFPMMLKIIRALATISVQSM